MTTLEDLYYGNIIPHEHSFKRGSAYRKVSSSYELMHEKEFPSLRIGSRLIVPKEKFSRWVEEKTGGSIPERITAVVK